MKSHDYPSGAGLEGRFLDMDLEFTWGSKQTKACL